MAKGKRRFKMLITAMVAVFLGVCGIGVNFGGLTGKAAASSAAVEEEISAQNDSGIGIDVKYEDCGTDAVEDNYFYFEEGVYPQTFAGVVLNETLNSQKTSGAISAAYTLAIGGQTCGVYNYGGSSYMAIVAPKTQNVSLDGAAVNFVEGETYWFKLEPIRWRVSPLGVAEDECPAIPYGTDGVSTWQSRFDDIKQYAVSDLVLHWGSSGMMSVGESTVSTTLTTQLAENWSRIKFGGGISAHEEQVNLNFDKVSSGTNAKVESESVDMAGLFQASLDEIENLYKPNKAEEDLRPDEKFNRYRRAKASDLICMLMGVDDSEWCSYSTRTLYNGNNCRMVTNGGGDKNLWLNTDYGMRLTYTVQFAKNASLLQYGNLVNAAFKNGNSQAVESLVLDFYETDSNGNLILDENGKPVYYGTEGGTTNLIASLHDTAIDVSEAQNGSALVYGGGTANVYLLSRYQMFANPYSTYFCNGLVSMTNCEFNNLNTSLATNMAAFFYNCYALPNVDVSMFNTAKVKEMNHVFAGCYELTSIDLLNWDTSNATTFWQFFYDCKKIESVLQNFDTSKVKNFETMFNHCWVLEGLDVSNWNTSNATDMSSMFNHCYMMTALDVSGWDVSKVTDMSYVFNGLGGRVDWASRAPMVLDVSNWDVSNVKNMYFMFGTLSGVEVLDVSNWDVSNVTNMTNMFSEARKIKSLNLSSWDTSNVTVMNVANGSGAGYSGMFSNCLALESITFGENFDTSNITNMGYMFYGCQSLTSLDVSGFDTSKVTDMGYMFENCKLLTTLDVSGFNTSNVTNMRSMFKNCNAVTALDVSDWNTSNVTLMGGMFYNCYRLALLDVSNWDTSSVTSMETMFHNCLDLEVLDVSNWDTSNVTHMGAMFYDVDEPTVIDVSGWDTSKVTNMDNMFEFCLNVQELDVSNWDVSNVTTMKSMFKDCCNIISLDLSNWNTSKVTNMSRMFQMDYGKKLTTIYVGDGWSTESVTNSTDMFKGCNKLVGANGTACDGTNNIDATYARVDWGNDYFGGSQMGYFTAATVMLAQNWLEILDNGMQQNNQWVESVKSIAFAWVTDDVSGLAYEYFGTDNLPYEPVDVSALQDGSILAYYLNYFVLVVSKCHIGIESTERMFEIAYGCDTFIFDNFETGNSLAYMFAGFGHNVYAGITIYSLDTSGVQSMAHMFDGCYLGSWGDGGLYGVGNWDVSSVTDMSYMFAGITVDSLDLSNWNCDLPSVERMFYGFSAYAGQLKLWNWDTDEFSSENPMALRLDSMFEGCNVDTIDLSGWNIHAWSGVAMFKNCAATTIYCNDMNFFDDTSDMFYGCNNLKGAYGTTVASMGNNASAWMTGHWIDGPYRMGYFTSKDFSFLKDGGVMQNLLKGFAPDTYYQDLNYDVMTITFDYFRDASGNITTSRSYYYNGVNILSSYSCTDVSVRGDGSILMCRVPLAHYYDVFVLSAREIYAGESIANMFRAYDQLSSITLRNLNTSLTKNFVAVFAQSSVFNLDLSTMETSMGQNMNSMFAYCWNLETLNIAGFETYNVQVFDSMFAGSDELRTIWANDFNLAKMTSDTDMFYACGSLVGGNGTAYGNVFDASSNMAVVDSAARRGYFTQPPTQNNTFDESPNVPDEMLDEPQERSLTLLKQIFGCFGCAAVLAFCGWFAFMCLKKRKRI